MDPLCAVKYGTFDHITLYRPHGYGTAGHYGFVHDLDTDLLGLVTYNDGKLCCKYLGIESITDLRNIKNGYWFKGYIVYNEVFEYNL